MSNSMECALLNCHSSKLRSVTKKLKQISTKVNKLCTSVNELNLDKSKELLTGGTNIVLTGFNNVVFDPRLIPSRNFTDGAKILQKIGNAVHYTVSFNQNIGSDEAFPCDPISVFFPIPEYSLINTVAPGAIIGTVTGLAKDPYNPELDIGISASGYVKYKDSHTLELKYTVTGPGNPIGNKFLEMTIVANGFVQIV